MLCTYVIWLHYACKHRRYLLLVYKVAGICQHQLLPQVVISLISLWFGIKLIHNVGRWIKGWFTVHYRCKSRNWSGVREAADTVAAAA